ncbi:polynucleotide 5' kinase/3' phosphatase [Ralstonia phage Reminis]|uniref:Polynucleotide 5' kinase/3' phosphatase n=1 Tax=Ralstonia phage Reminis TaxID=2662139 RepID=A0A5Q2UAK2_9CAUD|nr:polynucleotide 5' kinase/3' phosphatase [Ralstonia phage Reminis]
MKDTYIFDLDGTLSDGRHRLHLLPAKEDAHKTQAWDAFNLAAGDDLPFLDNIRLMNELYQFGKKIIILTGRSDVAKHITEKWLWEHGCNFNQLIMRPADDHRRDIEFKEEALKFIGLERIAACFDDLEHVAKHMRKLGLTCHLVTHYDEKCVSTSQHVRYPEEKPDFEKSIDHGSNCFNEGYCEGYSQAIADTKELNK